MRLHALFGELTLSKPNNFVSSLSVRVQTSTLLEAIALIPFSTRRFRCPVGLLPTGAYG